MNVVEYLQAPIPRGLALMSSGIFAVGMASTYISAKTLLKQADRVIADQDERLKILNESTEFLMEHADDAVLFELNEKLDFWRVIRGKAPREEDEA